MLLESDIFIAYLKREDWLKDTASRLLATIEEGKLGQVQVSTEVFHELYYVFSDFAPISVIAANHARLSTLRNLSFIKADAEIYLSALDLMETYSISSIFDALYAATALSNHVPDHAVASTDAVYDRIRGIKRIDVRKLSE